MGPQSRQSARLLSSRPNWFPLFTRMRVLPPPHLWFQKGGTHHCTYAMSSNILDVLTGTRFAGFFYPYKLVLHYKLLRRCQAFYAPLVIMSLLGPKTDICRQDSLLK